MARSELEFSIHPIMERIETKLRKLYSDSDTVLKTVRAENSKQMLCPKLDTQVHRIECLFQNETDNILESVFDELGLA